MTTIQDLEARGTMIFAWWMACLADAYHSAYFRRKPQLWVLSGSILELCSTGAHSDDDDYDIDSYTVEPLPPEIHDVQGVQSTGLSPRELFEVRRPLFRID